MALGKVMVEHLASDRHGIGRAARPFLDQNGDDDLGRIIGRKADDPAVIPAVNASLGSAGLAGNGKEEFGKTNGRSLRYCEPHAFPYDRERSGAGDIFAESNGVERLDHAALVIHDGPRHSRLPERTAIGNSCGRGSELERRYLEVALADGGDVRVSDTPRRIFWADYFFLFRIRNKAGIFAGEVNAKRTSPSET